MKLALWPNGRSRAMDSLTSLMDRLMDPSPFDRLPEAFQTGMAPAVNISEDEKTLTVSVELPGLSDDDIDVQILGNQLHVSAERSFEKEKKGKEFHRVEHQYGTISRSITLPPGLRTDKADAKYHNGILTLDFPKLEPTPATKIKIKS